MPHLRRTGPSPGFTLIELVLVIVILAILATFAVPRYLDMARVSRIASVKAMTAAVQTAANNEHLACLMAAPCAQDAAFQNRGYTFNGKYARMNYGWLDAGDQIGNGFIDDWVDYSGYTVVLNWWGSTMFQLDGAPDPTHCGSEYIDAGAAGADTGGVVFTYTAGC